MECRIHCAWNIDSILCNLTILFSTVTFLNSSVDSKLGLLSVGHNLYFQSFSNSQRGFEFLNVALSWLLSFSKLSENIENYFFLTYPAGIYLLKVNNRNTRARCQICSKLKIMIPERRQSRRSGIFIVNFEDIWRYLVLVFLLLTLNM